MSYSTPNTPRHVTSSHRSSYISDVDEELNRLGVKVGQSDSLLESTSTFLSTISQLSSTVELQNEYQHHQHHQQQSYRQPGHSISFSTPGSHNTSTKQEQRQLIRPPQQRQYVQERKQLSQLVSAEQFSPRGINHTSNIFNASTISNTSNTSNTTNASHTSHASNISQSNIVSNDNSHFAQMPSITRADNSSQRIGDESNDSQSRPNDNIPYPYSALSTPRPISNINRSHSMNSSIDHTSPRSLPPRITPLRQSKIVQKADTRTSIQTRLNNQAHTHVGNNQNQSPYQSQDSLQDIPIHLQSQISIPKSSLSHDNYIESADPYTSTASITAGIVNSPNSTASTASTASIASIPSDASITSQSSITSRASRIPQTSRTSHIYASTDSIPKHHSKHPREQHHSQYHPIQYHHQQQHHQRQQHQQPPLSPLSPQQWEVGHDYHYDLPDSTQDKRNNNNMSLFTDQNDSSNYRSYSTHSIHPNDPNDLNYPNYPIIQNNNDQRRNRLENTPQKSDSSQQNHQASFSSHSSRSSRSSQLHHSHHSHRSHSHSNNSTDTYDYVDILYSTIRPHTRSPSYPYSQPQPHSQSAKTHYHEHPPQLDSNINADINADIKSHNNVNRDSLFTNNFPNTPRKHHNDSHTTNGSHGDDDNDENTNHSSNNISNISHYPTDYPTDSSPRQNIYHKDELRGRTERAERTERGENRGRRDRRESREREEDKNTTILDKTNTMMKSTTYLNMNLDTRLNTDKDINSNTTSHISEKVYQAKSRSLEDLTERLGRTLQSHMKAIENGLQHWKKGALYSLFLTSGIDISSIFVKYETFTPENVENIISSLAALMYTICQRFLQMNAYFYSKKWQNGEKYVQDIISTVHTKESLFNPQNEERDEREKKSKEEAGTMESDDRDDRDDRDDQIELLARLSTLQAGESLYKIPQRQSKNISHGNNTLNYIPSSTISSSVSSASSASSASVFVSPSTPSILVTGDVDKLYNIIKSQNITEKGTSLSLDAMIDSIGKCINMSEYVTSHIIPNDLSNTTPALSTMIQKEQTYQSKDKAQERMSDRMGQVDQMSEIDHINKMDQVHQKPGRNPNLTEYPTKVQYNILNFSSSSEYISSLLSPYISTLISGDIHSQVEFQEMCKSLYNIMNEYTETVYHDCNSTVAKRTGVHRTSGRNSSSVIESILQENYRKYQQIVNKTKFIITVLHLALKKRAHEIVTIQQTMILRAKKNRQRVILLKWKQIALERKKKKVDLQYSFDIVYTRHQQSQKKKIFQQWHLYSQKSTWARMLERQFHKQQNLKDRYQAQVVVSKWKNFVLQKKMKRLEQKLFILKG